MSDDLGSDHLAGLLIEQFGPRAAAEAVAHVRRAREAGEEAKAIAWLAILDAVLVQEPGAEPWADPPEEDDLG